MTRKSTKRIPVSAEAAPVGAKTVKLTENYNKGKRGRPFSPLGYKKMRVILDTLNMSGKAKGYVHGDIAGEQHVHYVDLVRAALVGTGVMTKAEADSTNIWSSKYRNYITSQMIALDRRGHIEGVSGLRDASEAGDKSDLAWEAYEETAVLDEPAEELVY